MTNYVIFDEAFVLNGKVEDDRHAAINAISHQSDLSFVVKSEDPEKDKVGLEVRTHVPVYSEVEVLEVCFEGGKQRRTSFAVEVIGVDGSRKPAGEFTSSGKTSNYQKFRLTQKIKDFNGLALIFKGNDDRTPYFMVKGVRLAKHIDKPL